MIYTCANTSHIGKPVKVFVDGKEIEDAFFADTDAGLVKFYIRQANIDAPIYTVLESEITGEVTVIPDDE